MAMTDLLLTADRDGERLDQFLSRSVEGLTRSAAQRLIEEGAAKCNGRAVKKNARTAVGDVVALSLPDPEPAEVLPQDIPLDVVYEDEDVIVVNKPVGMVVHPAPGHPDGTLVNALLYHCQNSLSGINGVLRPGIVHRIDRDTSGLLIAAKNDAAHLALAEQLQDHSLYRYYEAVCVGGLREDGGGSEKWPPGGDPLGGAGPVSRLYPRRLPAGDGADPPDPGPHGRHRSSPAGGHGVRGEKAGSGAGGPVSPRPEAHLRPPPHQGDHDGGVSPARLVHGGAGQAGAGAAVRATLQRSNKGASGKPRPAIEGIPGSGAAFCASVILRPKAEESASPLSQKGRGVTDASLRSA